MATHLWNQADMDTDDVFSFHTELKLPESLHKGHALNVPNHTAQLSCNTDEEAEIKIKQFTSATQTT